MSVAGCILKAKRNRAWHCALSPRCQSSSSSSSMQSKRQQQQQHDHDNDNNISSRSDEPWWSLSSLHKKVATLIATSLPEEALHQVLSKKMNEVDGHKSVSINEAIVSARAREQAYHHQSSKLVATIKGNASENPLSYHNSLIDKERLMKEEIEQRALEKARERMKLELQAMEEQLKRQEEERIQQIKKDQEKKMELEYHRQIAFERWKASAEKERRQEEATRMKHINNDQQQALPTNSHSESTSSPIHQHTSRHHPILGPQIAHLSYKRIHLTPASTLASLPVYEKQRVYRHDRALNMAKDKKKTLWMGIPGVISLMEEEDGRLSILDGQHRVGMMALLEEEQRKLRERGNSSEADDESNNNSSSSSSNDGASKSYNNAHADDELAKLDLENVLVEVFLPRQPKNRISAAEKNSASATRRHEEQHDDKAAIFTEINKAEPVKLLDLPGVTNKRTRDIIDYAASHFHDTYPAMFSPSTRCRSPHLNLDNLRDALFASEVIQREKIGSGGELVKWITRRNEQLKIRYSCDQEVIEDISIVINGEGSEDGKRGTVNESAIKKARKHDFYLGLESTWLYK